MGQRSGLSAEGAVATATAISYAHEMITNEFSTTVGPLGKTFNFVTTKTKSLST